MNKKFQALSTEELKTVNGGISALFMPSAAYLAAQELLKSLQA
jgi:bacteriocin-like protein